MTVALREVKAEAVPAVCVEMAQTETREVPEAVMAKAVTREPAETIDRPLGPPGKLRGYEFYRAVLGAPRMIVAPMVDGSELQWRMLSRRFGAQLAYTPMIHARLFAEHHQHAKRGLVDIASAHGTSTTTTSIGEASATISDDPSSANSWTSFLVGHPEDRPLIAQFCANDPRLLLESAQIIVAHGHVDAVDLNLGCPQQIAKRGRYGAFLQEDWALIAQLIATLDRELSVPVTAKIRVMETVERTVDYARMVVEAGAQVLTVHGRLREQKGSKTGLADWTKIRAVCEAVDVPVIANGNILYAQDVDRCIKATGSVGVMVAETNLQNPALFADAEHAERALASLSDWANKDFHAMLSLQEYPLLREHFPAHYAAKMYMNICRELVRDGHAPAKCLSPGNIRGHLFKMLRLPYTLMPELRMQMGKANTIDAIDAAVDAVSRAIEKEVMGWTARGCADAGWDLLREPVVSSHTGDGVEVDGGYRRVPFWCLQPYIRPPADESETATGEKRTAAVSESAALTGDPEGLGSLFKQNQDEYKRMRVEANRLRKERREAQKEQARQKQKMPKHPKCMSCSSVAAKLCVHTLCAQCCRRQFIEVLKSEGTIDDDTDTAVSVTPCTETNTKVVLKYVDESGCNARVRIQRDVIAKVFCAVHSCHDWARWLGTPRPSSRKKARMQSSDLVVEGESAAVKDEQPKTEEEAQR